MLHLLMVLLSLLIRLVLVCGLLCLWPVLLVQQVQGACGRARLDGAEVARGNGARGHSTGKWLQA